MFNKEQVQKAIKEIDDSLAQLAGPRQVHLVLVNDVKLIQAVCMDYFDKGEGAKKDVGTEQPTEHTEPGNQDS